jgi:hypothetical protein
VARAQAAAVKYTPNYFASCLFGGVDGGESVTLKIFALHSYATELFLQLRHKKILQNDNTKQQMT